ncbi:type II toxin-antitoxin system PemK/MazF family toxin [Aquihabitans sp. McL0605]|uniref:type II toxin-antitoxin system PemK/MazF family toxin n=1 Tax=Aquihabitans sp. McL0605 TaxID=3415671 RepID=UPI003CEA6890
MPGTGALKRFKDKVAGSIRRGGSGAPATDTSATGGIEVSYRPVRNGAADPGEVVWTWVPFEDDPSQGKDRPVLVLGWDGPLLAAVQLSSKDHSARRDAHEWIEVGRGAWDPERRVSYCDASRLLRVEPTAVRREGAALDEEAFARVLARVSELHDWRR